jgi:hypothetical protein
MKSADNSFDKHRDVAAGITVEDTWSAQWFKGSEEWSQLSDFAKQAYGVFMERGRFSEDTEDPSFTRNSCCS